MIGVGDAGPTGGRPAPDAGSRATERECWIALSLVPGVGPAGFARLLAHYGSAAAAWRAGPAALEDLPMRSGHREAGGGDIPRPDAREVARSLQHATERAGGRTSPLSTMPTHRRSGRSIHGHPRSS